MINIIAKYWLEFLLGLLSGGLIFLCKKFWNMYQNEKTAKVDEQHEEIVEELKEVINSSMGSMREENFKQQQEIDAIKRGILDIQGEAFKNFCRILLQPEHIITVEELEECTLKHSTYKSLGGNHDGDTLFELVQEKAKNQLTQA